MRNPFYHRQGIVDARHFYGRGALVRSLFEMIDSGQSCAVVGERRIGKSSLLAHLADSRIQSAHQLDPQKTLSAVLDFLALHTCSPSELWLEIVESLEPSAESGEAQKILELTAEHSDLTFNTFRRALRKLKRKGFRVVLLCDEFELAVQNPQFDARFFGALRSLAGSEGVVFVTASRLSLLELGQYREAEVREKVLGSPFFNIFAEFTVGPFKDYEVAEMLCGSLEETQIRLDREEVAFLSRIAGRHPYCLQLAAYHLYKELQHAGLGRPGSRRGGNLPSEEINARIRKCRSEVKEQVGRELAKIFRNQWQHSDDAERRALATLAMSEQEYPEGRAPSPGSLDGRTLVRLETRGLVKEVRPPASGPSGNYRDTTQSSRRFLLFSELLSQWVTQQVTLPPDKLVSLKVEGSPLPPTKTLSSVAEAAVPQRYHVLEEIGRGGAGTVFKAWDDRLERLVAVKVLDRRIRDSPERLQPLLVEARTCAALHHPHIVTVFDIDTQSGFLVQEFLAGGSLRDLLEMMPILPLADVLSLAEYMGAALSAAHRAGVVHRDLKPENVLLAARPPLRASNPGLSVLPLAKLADFGTALRFSDLSQLGERRAVAGTLAYMAPEQLAGEETGPAADFFALGMVLHESRYGELPTEGVHGRSPKDALDEIMLRCLMPDPKQRFPTGDQLLAAVRRARPLKA